MTRKINNFSALGRMTPWERAMGRYMRAPDHDAGGGDAAAAAADTAAPDAAADAAAAAAADTPADDAGAADAAADDAAGSILGDAASPGDDAAGEEGAADDADAASGDAAQAEVVPFEGLAPPEGFEALDTEALAAATPILRGLGIETTEQAQEVVGQFAPIIQSMVEKAVTANATAAKQAQVDLARTWADETRADPELGGANYDKTVADAARALDQFFSPEYREFLTITGLGNNPEHVRGIAAIGRAIGEGTIHLGGAGDLKLEPHEKLYGAEFQPAKT